MIFRSPFPKLHYYHNKQTQVKESQYLIPTYSWTLTPISNWTCSVVTVPPFNAWLSSTWLSASLDSTYCVCVYWSCVFILFIFFFFFHAFLEECGYCSMNSAWTVAANVDFFQWTVHPCTVHGPTNFIFYQFFIKNGSHNTIYTFKNYFAIVISAISFQFQ